MRFPLLVVILLLLRSAAPVQGQSDTLRWQAIRRLSPADFRGTGALRSAADLHVELGGRGLLSFFVFESVAVWNRRAARLAPGDTLRLRQAQVLFDLTEWYAAIARSLNKVGTNWERWNITAGGRKRRKLTTNF